VRTAHPSDKVIPVGVRLRQGDGGVLYRKTDRLTTVSLYGYEPGEMLDYYA
jgi:hypothetical protein